ncbi:uncharacterized protein PHACADRAFT_261267 [Phanerochaete carnosa HHB-10118-sp]|uniref:Uncharacterized protein n=1 Tax=Phanerochaete carnosa (strain HHB-10118-sp) TaxID=650164 RepID=K5VMI2_PHACS|nr:uncharacterized protein PHACADRAFT_261267 [Phanerochaete carnosa HHB-10118-sp]EKM52678.1 hypothetical protein PHACADRAFT_261267 [Phanerochaete carnosa HHB-10118-sp]
MNTRNLLFYSLNAVRAISIISLLLLFASTIVTMVYDVRAVNAFIAAGKTETSSNSTGIDCSVDDCDYIEGSTVPNQPAGAFWAILNWLLVIWQVIVCILSEFGWPEVFFSSFFPILGPDFGLGALGVIQCLLGAAVLSHHVPELMLVAAFFVFAVGCLNILFGLIFRERAKRHRSVRAWREAGRDVLPTAATPPGMLYTGSDASRSGSFSSDKTGLGFGRQGVKWAEAQGYVVREPDEAVPPYASKPSSHASRSSGSAYSGGSRPASEAGGEPDYEHEHEHEHENEGQYED